MLCCQLFGGQRAGRPTARLWADEQSFSGSSGTLRTPFPTDSLKSSAPIPNCSLLIANLVLLFCGTQKNARLLGSRALRLLQGVNVLVQGLFPGAGLGQVVQAEH